MNFYLYLEQKGEGCDYTIGCGRRLDVLKATSLSEAAREAMALFLPTGDEPATYSFHGERAIATALIVQAVARITLQDIEPILRARAEFAATVEQKKKESEELELYARLRAKYEGGT